MDDFEKEGRARRPLTYDDRLAIERGLNRGDRIAWIARTIGRTQHTVAEEVRRNWTDDPGNVQFFAHFDSRIASR